MAAIDATFSSHATLTLMHIIPAAIFVVLAACVLLRRSRTEWLERLFFPFGAITGATAYAMNSYAIGGWVERSAVLVFTTWFLFSLGRAYRFRLRGQGTREREWMTRAVAVLLGIATARPVMGVFFATSARTHLRPDQFFGIAFWTGFAVNAVVIELWLHSKRRVQLHNLGQISGTSRLTIGR
jgi:prepilin signal peptidase PulO-like enzyme (type II secretory pathway)